VLQLSSTTPSWTARSKPSRSNSGLSSIVTTKGFRMRLSAKIVFPARESAWRMGKFGLSARFTRGLSTIPKSPNRRWGAREEGSGEVMRKGLSFFFGSVWSETGPAYTGGVATISSGRRPFPPGRTLLTLAGWLPFPRSGDHWRPFPFWLLLLTLVGGDHIFTFRSYIILYVNGDGVGTPPPPRPLYRGPGPKRAITFFSRGKGAVRAVLSFGPGRVRGGWQVSLVKLYFDPV